MKTINTSIIATCAVIANVASATSVDSATEAYYYCDNDWHYDNCWGTEWRYCCDDEHLHYPEFNKDNGLALWDKYAYE